MDSDNKEALFRLLRFNSNWGQNARTFVSLEDYLKKMKEGQKNIYFTFGASYDAALASPFYEPFVGKDVPVLVLTNQLDEFCLTSTAEYKGLKFVSIEQTQVEDIRKDLGLAAPEDSSSSKLPEEDVTNFCLWLKEVCKAKVAKVQLSKRLKNTPAILQGQMSSSMYMMMQMLQSTGQIPGG